MKNRKLWIFIGIVLVILVLDHLFGWSDWLRDTDHLAFLSEMVKQYESVVVAIEVEYAVAAGAQFPNVLVDMLGNVVWKKSSIL